MAAPSKQADSKKAGAKEGHGSGLGNGGGGIRLSDSEDQIIVISSASGGDDLRYDSAADICIVDMIREGQILPSVINRSRGSGRRSAEAEAAPNRCKGQVRGLRANVPVRARMAMIVDQIRGIIHTTYGGAVFGRIGRPALTGGAVDQFQIVGTTRV